MAVLNWRVGFCTENEINVWVKANNVGPYNIKIGGVGSDVATTADDNTGLQTRTGLDANTSYDIEIAGTVVGAVKTFPSAGSPVRIMGTNCYDKARNFQFGKIVEDRAPELFLWQGDNGYSHHAMTRYRDMSGTQLNTIACDAPVNNSTPVPQQDWMNCNRMFESVPGVKRVNQKFPNILIMSNHDRGGGIDDHTLGAYYADGGTNMVNQATANSCYEYAILAANAYRPDPPYEAVPVGGNDIPLAASSGVYVSSTYDPRYYSFTCGCVEVFVVDTLGSKNYNIISDSVNNLLGAKQEAWLISGVTSSTAIWKLIVTAHAATSVASPPGTWVNGWAVRQTQLNRIIDGFGTKPVTGVVWAGADWHAPSLQLGSGTHMFAASNMGPGGSTHNVAAPEFTVAEGTGDLVYACKNQNTPLNLSSVGQFDFTPEKLTLTSINQRNEQLLKVEMLPTGNQWDLSTIQTTAPTVTYDEKITGSSFAGMDVSSTWTPAAVLRATGFAVESTQTLIGLSFPISAIADTDVRSAELMVWALGAGTGAFRYWIEGTDSGFEWSQTQLPRSGDWSPLVTHTISPDIGYQRLDITDRVQSLLTSGKLWVNVVIVYTDVNTSIEIAGVGHPTGLPPQLVIQTID